MGIENLTSEQRQQIAIEEYKKNPLMSICQGALLMGAKTGIESGAEEIEIDTEGTFYEKRYKCKMLITWSEVYR